MLRPTLASFQLRVLSQLGACRSAPAPSLSAKLSSRAQATEGSDLVGRDLLFSFFSESLCLCVKSLFSLLTVNCQPSIEDPDPIGTVNFSLPWSSQISLRRAHTRACVLWPCTMRNKKTNAAQIWKQLEDHLVPRLRLSITDRAIYSHLLRHSRLEGRARLRFSIAWLARGARLSTNPARWAVRRLIAHGALRLLERGKAGHVVEVLLPSEIRACRPWRIARRAARPLPRGIDFELDFLKTRALRHAIHVRERGRCFYCLRRLTPLIRCLDHV